MSALAVLLLILTDECSRIFENISDLNSVNFRTHHYYNLKI